MQGVIYTLLCFATTSLQLSDFVLSGPGCGDRPRYVCQKNDWFQKYKYIIDLGASNFMVVLGRIALFFFLFFFFGYRDSVPSASSQAFWVDCELKTWSQWHMLEIIPDTWKGHKQLVIFCPPLPKPFWVVHLYYGNFQTRYHKLTK